MKTYLLPLLLLSICGIGCERRQITELNELEQEVAGSMVLPLALYEGQFPNARITNVAEVFGTLDLSHSHRSHPFVFQERFRRFGQWAGFTNSIYEKYIVIPPGVTNVRLGGEIILMNAEPFPDFNNGFSRMVIVRAGKQDYRPHKVKEEDVAETFRQSGINIPRPTPMPAPDPPPGHDEPRYPPATRVRMFFEDIAYHYGPGRFFWFPTMLVCVGLPLLIAVIFAIWFLRRSRRH